MGADGQLRQEIERTAVGVCQRQERKRASALVEVWSARRGLDDARGEDDVARKVVHREHYALRRTSRAGGIVEQYDAVVGYVAVLYVVDAELLAVCAIEGLVGALDGAFDARFVAVVRETEVREREDGLQRRHPRRIEVGHEVVADEEHAALRVVDDVHHVRRIEILKYGHDDGTIGDGGNIGYAPADVVAADQGNLVALAYARLVEEQMQFGDLAGRLQIGERVAAEVVRQGRQVAVVAETRFVYFYQILLQHGGMVLRGVWTLSIVAPAASRGDGVAACYLSPAVLSVSCPAAFVSPLSAGPLAAVESWGRQTYIFDSVPAFSRSMFLR